MTYRLRSPLLGSLGLLGLLAVHARAQVSTVRQLDCRKPLTLDVATRSVVGIPLDVSDSALEASLPPRSVERQVDVYDGDTVTTYTIVGDTPPRPTSLGDGHPVRSADAHP